MHVNAEINYIFVLPFNRMTSDGLNCVNSVSMTQVNNKDAKSELIIQCSRLYRGK